MYRSPDTVRLCGNARHLACGNFICLKVASRACATTDHTLDWDLSLVEFKRVFPKWHVHMNPILVKEIDLIFVGFDAIVVFVKDVLIIRAMQNLLVVPTCSLYRSHFKPSIDLFGLV